MLLFCWDERGGSWEKVRVTEEFPTHSGGCSVITKIHTARVRVSLTCQELPPTMSVSTTTRIRCWPHRGGLNVNLSGHRNGKSRWAREREVKSGSPISCIRPQDRWSCGSAKESEGLQPRGGDGFAACIWLFSALQRFSERRSAWQDQAGNPERFNRIIYSVWRKLQASGRQWELLLSKRKSEIDHAG